MKRYQLTRSNAMKSAETAALGLSAAAFVGERMADAPIEQGKGPAPTRHNAHHERTRIWSTKKV